VVNIGSAPTPGALLAATYFQAEATKVITWGNAWINAV